jgi:YD repeat-containing protein
MFSKTGGGLFPALSTSFTLKQDPTIPNFGWSTDPTNPNPTYFIKDLTMTYDGVGNPIKYETRDQVETSFIWETGNPSPIAKVVNATNAEIFYANFELNGVAETAGNPAKTGTRYFNSGNYNFSTNGSFTPANSSELKMSYWYWASGKWNFSGILQFQNTISIGTRLDDIRAYPKDAQMITFTYNQYGVTSISDANSQPTYYAYDLFGRLKVVEDTDKNLLQSLTYRYKGQD